MIHYTCDRCRKIIETENETRYTVTIEVKTAELDPNADRVDDRDHLMVIEDIMEQLEDPDCAMEVLGELVRRRTYDLCTECRDAYLQNPLAADAQPQFGFSDN